MDTDKGGSQAHVRREQLPKSPTKSPTEQGREVRSTLRLSNMDVDTGPQKNYFCATNRGPGGVVGEWECK